MKALPFTIQKFVFRDDPSLLSEAFPDNDLVQLVNIGDCPKAQTHLPGYFVMSSAPPNIEEAIESNSEDFSKAAQGIEEIADHLYHIHNQGMAAPEVVVTIHGYNTSRGSVQNWYKDIFHYINRYDLTVAQQQNKVFIGYRWPSENIEPKRFAEALKALPPLPRDVLVGGTLAALVLLILRFSPLGGTVWGFGLGFLLCFLILLGALMLALVVLRLIVYFRDNYRATNFGVPDLVELFRQLDQALVERKANEIQQANPTCPNAIEQATQFWSGAPTRKVKLSFVGHSMGGFVVTNVVRILSDVFDTRSVGKEPPPDIGNVFRLERLVLASPDIPVLSIISNRANFLASSLRRFSESYLFSNEGDIALRIASTAANYISFPSQTQSRGYRLGNVALRSKYKTRQDYGIVNLTSLDQTFPYGVPLEDAIARNPDKILDYLFLTSQRFTKNGYVTLAQLFQDQTSLDKDRITVTDFFTFFDCTDYLDYTFSVRNQARSAKPSGILSRARAKGPLRSWDYLGLTLDYGRGIRDVHGGYFLGEFSQQLLYRIVFLGFTGYLKTLDGDSQTAFDPHVALSKLHMQCREKGIQSFLSPIRYRADVQGCSLKATQQELINAIRQEPDAPSDSNA